MPVPRELDQAIAGDPRTIRERVLSLGEVDDGKRPVVVEGLKSLVLERFRQSRYADPIFHLSTPEEVQQAFEILKRRLIPIDESSRLRDWKSLEILLLLNHFSLEGKKPASQTELARILEVSQSTISIHQRQMLAMIDFPLTFYSTDFVPRVVEFDTYEQRKNLLRVDSPHLGELEKPQIRTLALEYVSIFIDNPVFQRLCAQAHFFGKPESYDFEQTEFRYQLKNDGQFPSKDSLEPFDKSTGRLVDRFRPQFVFERERLDWQEGHPKTDEAIKFEIYSDSDPSILYYFPSSNRIVEAMMHLRNTNFAFENAEQMLTDFKAGK